MAELLNTETGQQGIIFCKSSCGLSLAGSKKMKGFYDIDVTVTERSQNEKMEVKEGVMLKRDASFENLRGLVGFWFRFHTAKKDTSLLFHCGRKKLKVSKVGSFWMRCTVLSKQASQSVHGYQDTENFYAPQRRSVKRHHFRVKFTVSLRHFRRGATKLLKEANSSSYQTITEGYGACPFRKK